MFEIQRRDAISQNPREILPLDWNFDGTLSYDDLLWPVDQNDLTGRYKILLFIWTIY